MWELDHKESWAPKNWCFWTVVLERTLESPLGCKEIKLVNSKGNQSWIFTGRTDAEAEGPILRPLDVKNLFIGKDPDAGKEGIRRRGLQDMRWLHSITNSRSLLTHVHRVGDAIQPSHPLLSPSPLAFTFSQHQCLFKWVSSSHQVVTGLEFQLQPSVLPMNIQDWFPLGWTGWISLQSKGLSGVFSNSTV